eukprot:5207849-Amphidinium_carterae.1
MDAKVMRRSLRLLLPESPLVFRLFSLYVRSLRSFLHPTRNLLHPYVIHYDQVDPGNLVGG